MTYSAMFDCSFLIPCVLAIPVHVFSVRFHLKQFWSPSMFDCENCARLSESFQREFQIQPTFTKSPQWWRTSWRNLIFEANNNLMICFQFETLNFDKICQNFCDFEAGSHNINGWDTAFALSGRVSKTKKWKIIAKKMFSFGNHSRFLENLATRGQRAIEQSAPKLISLTTQPLCSTLAGRWSAAGTLLVRRQEIPPSLGRFHGLARSAALGLVSRTGATRREVGACCSTI